jgi:pimeloyl-ACP methyl ester carboxylesterase
MPYATNDLDDVRIYYEYAGVDGPPLVLYHGSATSSAMWKHLGYVEWLAESYRVILIDARGHGRSDKPHDEAAYTMPLIAADVVAVLDRAGVERAHFFGYSMGGRVAYGLGLHAPERFDSFIIGGGTFSAEPDGFDRATFPGALQTIATDGIEPFLDRWRERLGMPLPPGVREMYLANDHQALVAYLRRTQREPSHEAALARMTMPVLLFAGEHDTDRLDNSTVAATRLPDATLAVIPGENHASTIIRADKVLPHVMRFLARVTGEEAQAA